MGELVLWPPVASYLTNESAGSIIDTIGLPERLSHLRIGAPEVCPYYLSHRSWAAAREDRGVDRSSPSVLRCTLATGNCTVFRHGWSFGEGQRWGERSPPGLSNLSSIYGKCPHLGKCTSQPAWENIPMALPPSWTGVGESESKTQRSPADWAGKSSIPHQCQE
jgi:hypothetical protein